LNRLVCVAIGAWGLVLGASGRPQAGEVHVAAAVSLTEALQEVAAAFEKQQGTKVTLNLAASNVLARQIAAGSGADVFISADAAQMAVVAKEGLTRERVDLLVNQLAVVIRTDSKLTLASESDLLKPEVRRVAIGDPAGVPAGVYAKQFLEKAALWTRLQSKIVPTASVRAALAAVESGDADAAIVYRTDAAIAHRVRLAFPPLPEPRVIYPAALLTSRPEAVRFFEFLRSAGAAAIFRRHGFGVAGGAA
jgi:molybdate transport system substrate-binding protein